MDKGMEDVYLTVQEATNEVVFKDKGSKFLAYAFPLNQTDEVEVIIQELKRKHSKARHWCYAWQIGVDSVSFRYNDDGEPNNSAGKPIYGQILSFGLTNVLIVVVRYFGGTKLGVGGLITAYRSAAKLSLEEAVLIEKIITSEFTIHFEYIHMDKVMRIIKENNVKILDQVMELDCFYKLAVRRKHQDQIINLFTELRSGVQVKILS